jgi:hypothetical protein
MSLDLTDMQTLLQTQFPSTPIQVNRMLDQPDQQIVVCGMGGGAPVFDGAFEPAFVAIRTRAAANNDEASETLNLQVHAFLSSKEGSFQMGSTYVQYLLPVSGPPQYEGQDVDQRTIYISHYELVVLV